MIQKARTPHVWAEHGNICIVCGQTSRVLADHYLETGDVSCPGEPEPEEVA